MNIIKLDRDQLKKEYGILCQRILPAAGLTAPFGATQCVIPPGGSTAPHGHFEGETFWISGGSGRMTIGADHRDVGPGDMVFIPSGSHHVLTNTGPGDLSFLSIWWERDFGASRPVPKRVLVTSAPPTPNGNLHLGHLSGPYVAADAHVRFLRMNGVEASYLSGSDDNQSYTWVKATRLKQKPQETADHFADNIQATLNRIGAPTDYFLRPNGDPDYTRFVQDFFKTLVEKGKVVARDAETLYCEPCGIHLWEAHVSGGCPHCQLPTGGNGCEACGHTNDCVNLKDPACNHCKKPASRKTVKRFYFPLDDYRSQLAEYHRTVAMPPHLAALNDDLHHRGFPAISVSQVADWGIKVPLAGYEGQVIYEWFEMAAGYLYAASKMAPDGRWQHFWADPDARVVKFFGWDNSFFYSSFIPAVLLAYDPSIRLPVALVQNEFYRLDGLKFSTSRNHAIWGDEALEHVKPDAIRYYLAYDRPETSETSFGLKEFRDTVERELVRGLQGWMARADSMVAMELDRVVPEHQEFVDDQQAFHERLRAITREAAECYRAATFSPARLTRVLSTLVREAHEFGQLQSFLLKAPGSRSRWQAAAVLELTALRTFALIASPLMPAVCRKLLEGLGHPTPGKPTWDVDAKPLVAGTRLGSLATLDFSEALTGIDQLAASRK